MFASYVGVALTRSLSSSFTTALSEGSMRLITLDGGQAVDAVPAKAVGLLHPGERMDVVAERKEDAQLIIELDRE